MTKHLPRIFVIIAILSLSFVLIQVTRAPERLPFSIPIVCLPTKLAEEKNADIRLKEYAPIAHTTQEDPKDSVPSYRCYFGFNSHDVACAPQNAAKRQNLTACPHFPTIDTRYKKCYFINKKLHALHNLISQQPPVSVKAYSGRIVNSLQEAIFILSKPNAGTDTK